QRTSGGPQRQRFRRALVVSEVALAVVLVIGCGLMIKSFARLARVDTGMRPDGLLTMEMEIPDENYRTPADVAGDFARVEERLAALPGAGSATVMSGLPPNRRINANDIFFDGKTPPPRESGLVWNVDYWQTVGDDYFATLGIRLVAGRFLDARDVADAPKAVVINEQFARKFSPGEDPIGKVVHARGGMNGPAQTIVGVVGDVKQQGLEAQTGTEIYFPMRQGPRPPLLMNAVVRARPGVDPTTLAGAARAAIAGIDATIPVARVRTMDQVLWESVARPRFLTLLLTIFAGVALLLAAIGIYGVMSFSVEQRTHELGVRMALGARAGRVERLVMGQGLALTTVGVVVGLGLALAVNSALASRLSGLLFEVRALDPATFAGVAAVVAATAALACWLPARPATR